MNFETPRIGAAMCWAHDNWMIELLNKFSNDFQGIFLDIGVNLGQSLLAIKSVDPERQYVGLEPNPICISYVEQLIKRNDLSKTQLVPVGIGKKACLRRLYLQDGDTDSSATLVPHFRKGQTDSKSRIVPVFPFSMVRPQFDSGHIGIAKIDVEGAELEVLESMQGDIEKMRPLIFVEILPVYDSSNRQRMAHQVALENLIESIGYFIYRVAKRADDNLNKIVRIDKIGVHSDLEMCDYVLICQRKAMELEPLDVQCV